MEGLSGVPNIQNRFWQILPCAAQPPHGFKTGTLPRDGLPETENLDWYLKGNFTNTESL